jgi:hypothetical protein
MDEKDVTVTAEFASTRPELIQFIQALVLKGVYNHSLLEIAPFANEELFRNSPSSVRKLLMDSLNSAQLSRERRKDIFKHRTLILDDLQSKDVFETIRNDKDAVTRFLDDPDFLRKLLRKRYIPSDLICELISQNRYVTHFVKRLKDKEITPEVMHVAARRLGEGYEALADKKPELVTFEDAN